jgi:hypothetical protein
MGAAMASRREPLPEGTYGRRVEEATKCSEETMPREGRKPRKGWVDLGFGRSWI